MKAAGAPDYNIPMRGSGDQVSQTTLTFRAGGGTDTDVEFGLDDVTYDIPTLSAAAGTFEDGVDGAALSTSWVRAGTAFQNAEYDDSRRLHRQAGLALRLPQGPGHPDDGHRRPRDRRAAFHRRLRDPLLGQHEQPPELPLHPRGRRRGRRSRGTFWLRADADGRLGACTSVPGNPNGYTTNAYTQIGNLSTGWTEYKLTFNFSNDTYTVSTRTDPAFAWAPMKAAGATGYDIPMRGTADNTANTALTFRVGGGTVGSVELGLDDVRYSATPIPRAAPTCPSRRSTAPGATPTTTTATGRPAARGLPLAVRRPPRHSV